MKGDTEGCVISREGNILDAGYNIFSIDHSQEIPRLSPGIVDGGRGGKTLEFDGQDELHITGISLLAPVSL